MCGLIINQPDDTHKLTYSLTKHHKLGEYWRVERLYCEHPNHEERFVPSGMMLDERWSAQVQMTYHVHPDRQQGFNRAFSLEMSGSK